VKAHRAFHLLFPDLTGHLHSVAGVWSGWWMDHGSTDWRCNK